MGSATQSVGAFFGSSVRRSRRSCSGSALTWAPSMAVRGRRTSRRCARGARGVSSNAGAAAGAAAAAARRGAGSARGGACLLFPYLVAGGLGVGDETDLIWRGGNHRLTLNDPHSFTYPTHASRASPCSRASPRWLKRELGASTVQVRCNGWLLAFSGHAARPSSAFIYCIRNDGSPKGCLLPPSVGDRSASQRKNRRAWRLARIGIGSIVTRTSYTRQRPGSATSA